MNQWQCLHWLLSLVHQSPYTWRCWLARVDCSLAYNWGGRVLHSNVPNWNQSAGYELAGAQIVLNMIYGKMKHMEVCLMLLLQDELCLSRTCGADGIIDARA